MSAPLEKLLRDARIDLILARIEKDQSVINEVITHLDSEIRSVKFNAILILGELGQKSVKALPELIKCLKDEDWSICRETARTLGKIGSVAEQVVPDLIKLLEDKEEAIRKETVIALGKIASSKFDSVSKIINTLKDNSEEVRTEAAKTLGEIGADAFGAIQDLTNSLKDVSWTVRTAAAHAINQIGEGSIKSIPSLIIALEDRDWRVRFRVVNTLAGIGQGSISSLLEVLDHKNSIVRKGAVETLGEMKIADPQVIESLSKLLKDTDERVRGKAADSLRSIGKKAVLALVKALETSNSQMKRIIISAIGGISENAKEAIPVLSEILKLKEEDIIKRENYLYNLTFSKKILRPFLTFLKDPRSKQTLIRVEATRALGRIGMNSEQAVLSLEYALTDPRFIVRREAALSLGKLGSFAARAVPSLLKALGDKNPDVRWRTSEALALIGINTEDIISGLKGLVHDKCDYVCQSAINALDFLTE